MVDPATPGLSVERDEVRQRSALTRMAGIAWLVASASLAYVAFLETASIATRSWLASAIAVYLGVLLLVTPGLRYLWMSVLGAIALVLFAVDQRAKTSNVSDIFILPAVWALVIGIVSLLGLLRLGLARHDREGSVERASLEDRVTIETLPEASGLMSGVFDRTEPAPRAPASPNSVDAVSLAADVASVDACPHLGLSDDPETHFMVAVVDHRCHAGSKPEKVGLPHQRSYCLSGRHRECVRFTTPDRFAARLVSGSPVSTRALANGEAVFDLPIHRLRRATPGAYVPELDNATPVRTKALSRLRGGRL